MRHMPTISRIGPGNTLLRCDTGPAFRHERPLSTHRRQGAGKQVLVLSLACLFSGCSSSGEAQSGKIPAQTLITAELRPVANPAILKQVVETGVGCRIVYAVGVHYLSAGATLGVFPDPSQQGTSGI